MNALYKAQAKSSGGGRGGAITTNDARLALALSVPKGLGGDDGPGTNPEQLFAAGYAACFAGALGVVARASKKDPGQFTIDAQVTIGKEGEAFKLAVTLGGHFPDLPAADAQELLEAAHRICPYSVATRGNVDVTLEVI
jgi:osmotically inducible protein OsmC